MVRYVQPLKKEELQAINGGCAPCALLLGVVIGAVLVTVGYCVVSYLNEE